MQVRELTREDIEDILYGCAILGTGGGGELEEGFDYIDRAIAAGKTFKMVSIDDAPLNAKVCTPYMLGALSPMSVEEEERYQGLPKNKEPAIDTAFKRLQSYTGDKYFGTICCELGGSNTAISFYLAAMHDGYIIDADPAGRAVPEITHSTYYFNDLNASPIITANEFGECFICENIKNDERAEHIVRALSMVSRNDIAAIDHALTISEVKHAVIKGTISKALVIGKAFRKAKEDELDLAEEIAKHGHGVVRFKGKVSDFSFSTKGGFTIGEFLVNGTGEFKDNRYKVAVKNENLVSYLNGEVDVTIPDLICCLDLDINEPVTNPHLTIGSNVAIVVLPAPKEFKTERGLAAFGPKYLGLEMKFSSILCTD
ncbi:hypothetical protein KUL17_13650 [Alteromonas sp. KUL17]|uniref:DUF917 domain-containing protein n=1 Tax=Alteromonas sp. KUL17 TaxID=2480796 RepID=UPI001037488D|nr:DUF917 domain-containing protein [Alteromonas sp. KUL17]TAP29534.1 DUF917 domain-containing protein [Alteromonas sp. KUL17]GEA02468.1 hypothetical protein KUL17_13650 [Alteromonas sp. KUL17]